MQARVIRGVHRIGIVLAVPFLALALYLAIQEIRLPSGAPIFEIPEAVRQSAVPDGPWAGAVDCGPNSINCPTIGHEHDFTSALFFALIAAGIFIAARALGWNIAGFRRQTLLTHPRSYL